MGHSGIIQETFENLVSFLHKIKFKIMICSDSKILLLMSWTIVRLHEFLLYFYVNGTVES